MQQIARTVVNDGELTEEQANFVDQIIPISTITECYNPKTVNRIKFSQEFDDEYLEAHKLTFLRTWFQIMPHNVGSYVRAWSDETIGYWSIRTNSWLVADVSYALTDSDKSELRNLLEKVPLFNKIGTPDLLLAEKYEDVAKTSVRAYRSLAYPVYNTACMVWFLLFASFMQLAYGRLRRFTVYLPLILSWATLLVAAPTFCEFRFLFFLYLALPFLFLLLRYPIDETIK